ncbi:hypothetical protein VCV18_009769 [Metarhizium anisopliae]
MTWIREAGNGHRQNGRHRTFKSIKATHGACSWAIHAMKVVFAIKSVMRQPKSSMVWRRLKGRLKGDQWQGGVLSAAPSLFASQIGPGPSSATAYSAQLHERDEPYASSYNGKRHWRIGKRVGWYERVHHTFWLHILLIPNRHAESSSSSLHNLLPISAVRH